ncbi:MAG: protoheme IX farnesyltransferase, partial [Planctomycetes bacterium]|nr:protoheme IX farnesyltransferase [Planctomycetota bacterium]
MPGNPAVASYVKLVRLKIVALVVFTMVMAAWIAGGGAPAWRDAAHLIVGTTFVILGSLVLNHRLERRADGIMARTAERPLPRGRMTGTQALLVGCSGAAGGLVYLAVACGRLFAVLAALACLLYVVVYTLLKPLTPWQTPIGALAGALPVLMGAALASDVGSVMSTTLFGIAYFWQFPHAMAIAWLYRSQYALAGVKVA